MNNSTHKISVPFNPKHIDISIDSVCNAVYVQFSRNPVTNTIDCSRGDQIVTVDIDEHGNAIGVEAIGLGILSINRIFEIIEPHVEGIKREQLASAEIAPLS